MGFKESFSFKYWPQATALALLLLGYAAYRYFAYYDTRSSDAYVSAHVINMEALVSGPVTQIYVQENQKVKKGEKLLEIDPLPLHYAVEEAKSKLNIAQLNYQNEKEMLINEEQQLKKNQNKLAENQVLVAQAELDQANYFLNHTTLVAPKDGYITNFNLRVGQYVTAGQGLFAFIEAKLWWIVTRYRETAIRLIQPGDKATIMIDMYPGKVFHGHVQSIAWGVSRTQVDDTTLTPLPYMEATEDWIRIAQRFPVWISIDDLSDEYPLRIGASATTITYR